MNPNADYPPNWREIAYRIKQAANWSCERCAHPNDPQAGYTLTVHHLDGDKSNCHDHNLVALCQRCHLHVQARYTPGQLSLPLIGPRWLLLRLKTTPKLDPKTS